MNTPRSIFTGTVHTQTSPLRSELRRPSTPESSEPLSAQFENSPSSISPQQPPKTPFARSSRWSEPSADEHSIRSDPVSPTHVSKQDTQAQPSPITRKKRSFEQIEQDIAGRVGLAGELGFHKKRRIDIHRAPHTLDQFDFKEVGGARHQPPSPLFFSNTKHRRPPFPARFSSSEAAARMLSNTGAEESSVKYVKLARGTFSGISPSSQTSYPYYRAPSDRLSLPRTTSSDSSEKNDPQRLLSSIGVTELLEHDPRPTLLIDLLNPQNYESGPLHFLFFNNALREDTNLTKSLTETEEAPAAVEDEAFAQFKAWMVSAVVNGEALDVTLPAIEHAGYSWTCTTIRKRFRIISGIRAAKTPLNTSTRDTLAEMKLPAGSGPPSSRENITSAGSGLTAATEGEPQDYFGNAVLPAIASAASASDTHTTPTDIQPDKLSSDMNGRVMDSEGRIIPLESHPSISNECVLSAAVADDVNWSRRSPDFEKETGFFDWTRLPISDALPKHIQFARSVDWASTSLGPIETWSADLRQMCNLIMASPHPAAMYWGDDLIAIYNEAYIMLAGQKHPTLMGQSYSEAWAEIWDDVKDVFAEAKMTGKATMKVWSSAWVLL
jgi:hypothetical protein